MSKYMPCNDYLEESYHRCIGLQCRDVPLPPFEADRTYHFGGQTLRLPVLHSSSYSWVNQAFLDELEHNHDEGAFSYQDQEHQCRLQCLDART